MSRIVGAVAVAEVQIDCFAMNLTLPRMAIQLNSTATYLRWVVSVYILTLDAFMVPASVGSALIFSGYTCQSYDRVGS